MAITFNIESAAVWNPAGSIVLPAETSFPLKVFTDETPNTKGLALPVKRKLSVISKSALLTASACGNAETLAGVPYVFSSHWGEWTRELQLLFERAETGLVSQGGFSLSVHNTPPSLFTLMYKNRNNYTAISAGSESLEAALLQAAMWLKKHERVLLTFGEEPPPQMPGVVEKTVAGTISILISRGNDFSIETPGAGTVPLDIAGLLAGTLAGTAAGTLLTLKRN